MSTIKKQINKDFVAAFKAKEMKKKNILGFLKSEIAKKEQAKGRAPGDATDDEAMAVVKKSIKNQNEVISTAGDNQEVIDAAKFEISILEVYLPEQMSEEEIDAKIKEVVDGGANNIGQIMGAFKGLGADKKLVSQKAKQILSN